MIDIEELTRRYEANSQLYVRLKEEALFILEPAIRTADIKCHSIPSRIKTVNSFLKKIQRREPVNQVADMTDIVGIRIVCLFLSDIERIARLIRETFFVTSEDSKVEGTDVSSFGYMSVHFVVRMKPEYASAPRYQGITDTPFEIQVRTIAMDAWASVSHYLDYKSERDVPDDLKRDFYALSGLFYVADKHFEMFYGSSRRSQEQMTELFEDASLEERVQQEINLDSLKAYLHKKLPNRRHSDDTLSFLIDELLTIGYRTIGEIDQMLDRTVNAFTKYEAANSPFVADGQFADVGVVRVSASLNDEKYHRMIYAGDKEYREITDEDLENPEYVSLKEQYDEYRKKILNEQP